MPLNDTLQSATSVVIKQLFEVGEMFGFETRNRYQLFTSDGTQIASAEEESGFFSAIARQFLGHFRSYSVQIDDRDGNPYLTIRHPFRFYFSRFEVTDALGNSIGVVEQRFSVLTKKLSVLDNSGNVILEMRSGLFKLWTFPLLRGDTEVAVVTKKWGGMLSEVFTDKDTFVVDFKDSVLTLQEKQLLLATAIFLDMRYFEAKR